MKPKVLILLLAAGVSMAAGQSLTKTGTTAAKFLSIPVGARALGMGGAFVAVADDPSAMYWNPAGIARLNRPEALLAHSDWIADINFNYAGVVVPVEAVGTFGINFTSLTMAEMERTTEEQPDGTGEFFGAGSFAVGVAYSRNLTEWFSIGFNAKYISEHIWNSTASGIAIDVGTLFITPFPGLKFGAGISNFGGKLQMMGEDLLVQKDISPNHGNNPNINANLTTDRFDLPLNLRIGIAYQPVADEWQSLTLVADAAHPNDNLESINVGAEYLFLQRMLAVRGGYKGYGLRGSEEEFTLGGGLVYGVTDEVRIKIDYAYERFGRLREVHKFSLGFQF